MKLVLSVIFSVAAVFLFGACNQHSWEGEDGKTPVKEVFAKHGHHDHEDHEGEDHHGKKDDETEEKDGEDEKEADQ